MPGLSVVPVPTWRPAAVTVPAGMTKGPVMVSPAFSALEEAAPVSAAVMVPAAKLPDASRTTIALAVLALAAVVAELLTLPAVAMVASLVSTIAADALTSAFKMVPSSNIALVTVPVSPVVTNVPVILGNVKVRSAVGSTTASVVSKPSAVAPSKLKVPPVPISRLPVTVPPALPNFSSSSSWIAV